MKKYQEIREELRLHGAILAGFVGTGLFLLSFIISILKGLGIWSTAGSLLPLFTLIAAIIFLIVTSIVTKNIAPSNKSLFCDILRSDFTRFLVVGITLFLVSFFA